MMEEGQEPSNWMESEFDENKDLRPKRGSTILFQKAGEFFKRHGKIKHVGKLGSKKKITCWIEKNNEIEEFDFVKDISGWKYEV